MLGLLFLVGCRAPALPPELVQVDLKQGELRAVEAETYFPEAYRAFRADRATAEAKLAAERQRLFFLRDLGPVRGELAELTRRADALLTAVKINRGSALALSPGAPRCCKQSSTSWGVSAHC